MFFNSPDKIDSSPKSKIFNPIEVWMLWKKKTEISILIEEKSLQSEMRIFLCCQKKKCFKMLTVWSLFLNWGDRVKLKRSDVKYHWL